METENTTRRRRRAARPRRREHQSIQYTQPKPFFRRKLMIQLLTLAAVVMAVTVGVSVFFKVDTVVITGAEKYSSATVAQAAGIEPGDSLLFFGRGSAASRIKSALPYVGKVRFQVKLPGTVHIIIEEKTVAYAMQADDGSWWKVSADGTVVEQAQSGNAPNVVGVLLRSPQVGHRAQAADSDGTTTATQADRLEAAVQILQQVERWEMFSSVTQVDVSDVFALRLYCQGNYRVELGSTADLSEKIGLLCAALEELADYGGGVLKLFYEDEKWRIQCNPWS